MQNGLQDVGQHVGTVGDDAVHAELDQLTRSSPLAWCVTATA
jgi:hypothetical protein